MREVVKISKKDFEEIRWKVHVYGDIYLVNRYIRNTCKHIMKAIFKMLGATIFLPLNIVLNGVFGLIDIAINTYDDVVSYLGCMKYLLIQSTPLIILKIRKNETINE